MKHTDCFFTITVEGVDYPCALTNGALLRFAETTGHDFGAPAEAGASQLRESLAIIHACAVSGAEREGKQFPMSLMELADHTSPADITRFAECIASAFGAKADDGTKAKKKPSESSTSKG